jgi:hypothetical protein
VVLLKEAGWPACLQTETSANRYVAPIEADKLGDYYIFDLQVPTYTKPPAAEQAGQANDEAPCLCNTIAIGGDLFVAPKLGKKLTPNPLDETTSVGHVVRLVHKSKKREKLCNLR